MTYNPNQPQQPNYPQNQGYQQGPPQGYQGPPPQGWQQPAPLPKKKHTVRNVFLGIVGVIVLLIVIAGVASGGKKDDATKSTPGSPAKVTTKASPGVSKGIGSKDASADITVGKADDTNGFDIEVPVTAKNSSSKRSDYLVSLSLESADGSTQYDTATAFLQNVEPGQTATDKGAFLKQNKIPAGSKVVVKEVQRTAST